MKGSRRLIAQALDSLKGNMERTGDPMGFKNDYWTAWAEGMGLARNGDAVLMTSRMYQMLPYVMKMTEMISKAKPIQEIEGMGKILSMGHRIAGEALIRWKAKGDTEITERGVRALRGAVSGLKAVGVTPGYLFEEDHYSGALLYDLGLSRYAQHQLTKAYETFKKSGAKEVIVTDPHTLLMLREVAPQLVGDSGIPARHYLELLAERKDRLKPVAPALRRKYVMHDPCMMARSLGIVDQVRGVGASLGITVIEPENTKQNTMCCGGPIEYAFPELSRGVSGLRIRELAKISTDILVACPVCLMNLYRYEKEMGLRVRDMGEVLYEAANGETPA